MPEEIDGDEHLRGDGASRSSISGLNADDEDIGPDAFFQISQKHRERYSVCRDIIIDDPTRVDKENFTRGFPSGDAVKDQHMRWMVISDLMCAIFRDFKPDDDFKASRMLILEFLQDALRAQHTSGIIGSILIAYS